MGSQNKRGHLDYPENKPVINYNQNYRRNMWIQEESQNKFCYQPSGQISEMQQRDGRKIWNCNTSITWPNKWQYEEEEEEEEEDNLSYNNSVSK